MEIKARKVYGSQYSSEDLIEVEMVIDKDIVLCNHTVVLVSGVPITHGGGASSGEYLHYKSHERDADDDGNIDYSNLVINIEQQEKGTSVIKIVAEYATQEEIDAYDAKNDADFEQWKTDTGFVPAIELNYGVEPPEEVESLDGSEAFWLEVEPFQKSTVETGEITLDWTEDTFV